MSRKRGALSIEEEEFIQNNINRLGIHGVAVELNRTDVTIEKYCNNKNLTYKGMSEDSYDDALLKAKLQKRPYWREVKKQLTSIELDYFEITWANMMKQFKENILYAEELQLKQWIILDIMGNKVLEERRRSQSQIERLQNLVDEQYSLSEDDRDVESVVTLESNIAMLTNAQSSYTAEYAKILEKIERIQKDLKAARADRVKKVEDSKSSFSGLLHSLEIEDNRKKVGEDIIIGAWAKNKAIDDLSKFHKYEDGFVDQPWLTPETARDE